MKKLMVLLLLISGCSVPQPCLEVECEELEIDMTDIRNWFLSPCFEDEYAFETCYELFWQNRGTIEGGEEAIRDIFWK